jgi:predicted PurR-regulated permease PerM
MERGPMMLLSIAIAGFLTLLLLLTASNSVAAIQATPIAPGTRRRLRVCVGRAQHDVSRYLGWIVLINALLGAVVALVMALLGLNNPLMWGLLAGVANFVPYVGPMAVLVLIWIAGVVQFDSVLAGSWPAVAFLALTSIEGQLVTPSVLGRHLSIPPPLIFVAILVLGWSWGLVGAFLAVPALVTGKSVIRYWPNRAAAGPHIGSDRPAEFAQTPPEHTDQPRRIPAA